MGRTSIILIHTFCYLLVPSKEDKQRILDTIQAHNTCRLPTEEEINDPNFKEEVGEELKGIVYQFP